MKRTMTTSSKNDRLQSGFLHWISIQRNNLKELLHVLTVSNGGDVELLRRLADKNIQHLIDYQQIKSGRDIYSPFWGTSLENSLFWMGGFKPSIYIRLACSITGMEPEILIGLKKLKVVDGESSICGEETEEYSSMQVKMIKALHANTVSRETQISSRMTNLQSKQVDQYYKIDEENVEKEDGVFGSYLQNILTYHSIRDGICGSRELWVYTTRDRKYIFTPLIATCEHLLVSGEPTGHMEGTSIIEPQVLIPSNDNSIPELECAFAAHGVALSGIVVDADELRVTVLKELMHILTPIQGIHLLVASYRLHLSIHECGKK